MTSEKILVLSIDRDDDLGRKAGVKGPVLGPEKVKEAAHKLGLADPEDSDFNAMFEAMRVYEEVKQGSEAQVAVLTGHKNVGFTSDKIVSEQFNQILKKFPATGIVFVTDGVEDEHTLPIIQSKVPVISVRRVLVKQAPQLESSYYKAKDFLEESLKDPKLARVVFGLPALTLLLLGLFGLQGFRFVLAILGIYLLVKGFKLEKSVTGGFEELRIAFAEKRLAFFTYTLAIVIGGLSVYRGYGALSEWASVGIFESVAAFFFSSAYFFWIAVSAGWFARLFSHSHKHTKGTLAAGPIFGFAIALVISNASEMVLKPVIGLTNFLIAIVLGFALIGVAVYLEKRR